MKKLKEGINLLVIICALITNAKSQSMSNTFQMAYGGIGHDICSKVLIKEGKYTLIGYTTSFGAGSYDLLFLQTDSIGTITRSNSIGASNEDLALSAVLLNDSKYLLCGYTNSFGIEHPLVSKLDSNGALIWAKYFSLNGWAHAIIPLTNGSMLVAGDSYNNTTNTDIFLMKVDELGNLLWVKSFGDSLINEGKKIIQTRDGGILILGNTHTQAGGPTDLVVIKTDSVGNLLWSNNYGSSGWDLGFSIIEIGSDIYIGALSYTDKFNNSPNSEDILMLRLDSAGGVKKAFVLGSSDVELIRDIYKNNDGTFSITGATNKWGNGKTDLFFVTIDTSGKILNQQVFGSSSFDQGLTLKSINNNTFLIAGYTKSFGSGEEDIYFIKTDTNFKSQCNLSAMNIQYSDIHIEKKSSFSGISINSISFNAPLIESPISIPQFKLCSSTGIKENLFDSELEIFPNPFSSQTTLSITLKSKQTVQINIYDILGKNVKEVTNETLTSGKHQIVLNASELRSGIYFCDLKTDYSRIVNKIVIE